MSDPSAPSPDDHLTDEPAPTPRPAGAAQLAALVAVLASLGWAYWRDLLWLRDFWERDPNYSHGYLVLPVVAFMFWWRWPRQGKVALRPSAWGWVAVAALIALRLVLLRAGQFWAQSFTIVPTVAALAMAYGGWPLLRRTWPAIAFLVFMFPVPVAINDRLSLPLQRVASWSSTRLLRALGLWVMNEGNVLIVGGEQLEVARACNGLAMLMSLSATIAATIILVPMANWKRVILLLSIVPIALLCNVTRISGTAWCYHLLGGEEGRQLAHDLAGWLMMPMALVLVLLELGWLSWLVREEEPEDEGVTFLTAAGVRARPSH